jgi:3-dehydroquinate synthetase
VELAMAGDKKHTRLGQRYILASGIGDAFVVQGIPQADIRSTVRNLLQQASPL